LKLKTGDPGWIRTSDLQLRRLLLYPLSYGAVAVYSGYRFTPPVSLAMASSDMRFPEITDVVERYPRHSKKKIENGIGPS
jgi:hypothetical protein